MKPQNITVKSAGWERIINVDPTIFDDVYVEACTQAMETNFKENNMLVAPFIEASVKNKKRVYIFNSYKILSNAGYHTFAENLRKNVKRNMSVDLKNEPIRG
jgi:hypothetical protein